MSYQILCGDAKQKLETLADNSIQCIVTSPPYYGLRDYGVAGQIGLEQTPDEYIAKLVDVFREARYKLADDGTLWVNIGDSYSGNGKSYDDSKSTLRGGKQSPRMGGERMIKSGPGLKPRDLIGIPWMLAFALRADGWYLRQDIIWEKPNPMPESVTNRCTKAHEYVFLLTKSPKYYCNMEAIAEPLAAASVVRLAQDLELQQGSTRAHGGGRPMKAVESDRPQLKRAHELAEAAGLTEEHIAAIRACGITDAGKSQHTQSGHGKNEARVQQLAAEAKRVLGGYYREFLAQPTRNARSVWRIATQPYKEAHFAVMPPELARRCVLAGSRPGDVVCDMFNGSGTTGQEALTHGRAYIGIDLNPAYVRLSHRRLSKVQFKLSFPQTSAA